MNLVYRYRDKKRKGGEKIEDEVILKQFLAGNEDAFRILVSRYTNYLFQAVYSVIRNQKDAEDITQEAFIQIYASLPSYKGQGLKTWMTRIAVNKAIDFKRSKSRKKEEITDSLEAKVEQQPNENLVEALILTKEQRERIRKRLYLIPENYRDVLYAYYMEEKSYQEIANDQGIEVKTVESKLYRAKKWIRKHWKEEDFQ